MNTIMEIKHHDKNNSTYENIIQFSQLTYIFIVALYHIQLSDINALCKHN